MRCKKDIFLYRYKNGEETCENLYDENLQRCHTGEQCAVPEAATTVLGNAEAGEGNRVEENDSGENLKLNF